MKLYPQHEVVMAMQLQRRHTIKRAGDFAYVRAVGRSWKGRYIVLNVAARRLNGDGNDSRFGIITTRRIGGAVVRNRQRRRIREILRAHGAPLEHGRDVVIVVKVAGGEADYAGLREDFIRLVERQQRAEKNEVC